MIWERVPKCNYVSLPNLEFGVYDAVANFNVGMKASILIYEKLDMIPGRYSLRGCKQINMKRIKFSEYQIDKKNKVRRQFLRAKKLKKSDKILENEDKLYEAGGF